MLIFYVIIVHISFLQRTTNADTVWIVSFELKQSDQSIRNATCYPSTTIQWLCWIRLVLQQLRLMMYFIMYHVVRDRRASKISNNDGIEMQLTSLITFMCHVEILSHHCWIQIDKLVRNISFHARGSDSHDPTRINTDTRCSLLKQQINSNQQGLFQSTTFKPCFGKAK